MIDRCIRATRARVLMQRPFRQMFSVAALPGRESSPIIHARNAVTVNLKSVRPWKRKPREPGGLSGIVRSSNQDPAEFAPSG
jgi:hypothetical protein